VSELAISVLIPTLGRKDELINTVKALLRQTRPALEIIVSDQNSPRIKEVDEFLSSIPQVKHIHSTLQGVPKNYNLLLREAKAEVVLFVDDDIEPPSDLLENHLKNYGDSSVDAVAGRVDQPDGDPDPRTITQVGHYNQITGHFHANYNGLVRMEVDASQGCNMSFRREKLLAIGGFDESFDGNGYFFETDGGLRFRKAGFRMIFDPKATLKHLRAPRGGARVGDKSQHTYFYIANGLRLFRKHSPAVLQPLFVTKQLAYAAAKGLYNRDPRIFALGVKAIIDGYKKDLSVQKK
jgi:GT2 family glycosyltransferase